MTILAHVSITSSVIAAIPLHGNLHCNIAYIPPHHGTVPACFFIHDQIISKASVRSTDAAPFETRDRQSTRTLMLGV